MILVGEKEIPGSDWLCQKAGGPSECRVQASIVHITGWQQCKTQQPARTGRRQQQWELGELCLPKQYKHQDHICLLAENATKKILCFIFGKNLPSLPLQHVHLSNVLVYNTMTVTVGPNKMSRQLQHPPARILQISYCRAQDIRNYFQKILCTIQMRWQQCKTKLDAIQLNVKPWQHFQWVKWFICLPGLIFQQNSIWMKSSSAEIFISLESSIHFPHSTFYDILKNKIRSDQIIIEENILRPTLESVAAMLSSQRVFMPLHRKTRSHISLCNLLLADLCINTFYNIASFITILQVWMQPTSKAGRWGYALRISISIDPCKKVGAWFHNAAYQEALKLYALPTNCMQTQVMYTVTI